MSSKYVFSALPRNTSLSPEVVHTALDVSALKAADNAGNRMSKRKSSIREHDE
jgi:hypothetical protein